MANVLGNNPGVLIAQRALATLLEEFPFLKSVASDFSADPALFNQAINVKLPTAFGAAASYHTTNGYVAVDANSVDIPLTINRHVHCTYGFNDQERASTNVSLIEMFAAAAAQSLGLAMVTDLFALVTQANFANHTASLPENFNRAAVITVGRNMSLRKVPKTGRFMVINSDYAKTLQGDTLIVANAGSPSDAVKSGNLGKVHGFETFEYPQFKIGDAGYCYGIAALPEALVIATRLPPPPDKADFPGTLQVVTEPNSGLSLQYRSWYNPNLGKEFRTYTLMFGVAKGNTAAMERLTSVSDT